MSLPKQRIEITETTTAYCGYTIKAVYDAAFDDWEWFVEKTNDPDSDYAMGGEFDSPEDAITDAKKWVDRRLNRTPDSIPDYEIVLGVWHIKDRTDYLSCFRRRGEWFVTNDTAMVRPMAEPDGVLPLPVGKE